MKTDKIFKSEIKGSNDFLSESVADSVFDDMNIHSVPFYSEIQRMITEIAFDYAKPDTSLYDLGCSTGTTMLFLDSVLDKSIRFVGIDDSAVRLAKCRKNFKERNVCRPFELINYDLNTHITINNASVVVLCLTLQFVRPDYRPGLLRSIQEQLNDEGCIIVIEKILGETTDLNRRFNKYYYDFKHRNKSSEIEIPQKRESLENALIPYKLSKNLQLMVDAGFRHGEIFFKWYNFIGLVAIKNIIKTEKG